MKDLLTTLGIDVTVLCLVIFGEIELIFKIVLLGITIAYTILKLINEYYKYENNKHQSED
jgi:hypothetical protein